MKTQKIPIKGYRIWMEAKIQPIDGCEFGANEMITGATKTELIKNFRKFLTEIDGRSVKVLEW